MFSPRPVIRKRAAWWPSSPAAIQKPRPSCCWRTSTWWKPSAKTGYDPFKLVEENGKFYARGAVDDKAQAAIWADTLIRYKSENYQPRHTLKLALTCGEETGGAFNGAQWLSE